MVLVEVTLLKTHGVNGASLSVLLGNLIGVSSVHFFLVSSVWKTNSSNICRTLQAMDKRSGLPVPLYPTQRTSLQSNQLWTANHDMLGILGNVREFLQHFSYFKETPPSNIVGNEMLFLCSNCAVPNCMWQSWHPEVDVYLLELVGLMSSNGSSRSISISIHVRLRLCLRLDENDQRTNWYCRNQERETCIDLLRTRTGRLFSHNGSPRSVNWIRVWLGWFVFCLSSNFWTQFLHPIISQGNKSSETAEVTHKLFRITPISIWMAFEIQQAGECIVKDNGVPSRLLELQSFLLSKIDVGPRHHILMFMLYAQNCARRGAIKSIVTKSLWFVHGLHTRKEYSLYVA